MKVLIADDDPVACLRLESCLSEWGYEVVTAADGATASQLLQVPDGPNLAILDWMMPGLDGRDICREVRQRPPENYIYLLLLTARGRKDDIAAGFEAGADDYLVKPFDLIELRARLLAGQRILQLHADLIAAREAMRHQAMHDALTGVWNRRAIFDSLDRELNRARRTGKGLSIILTDLDHFKRVNDTYGHQAGDAVLQHAARTLEQSLRPYDLIGRYGGEEFLIVLPSADLTDAMNCAERLREQLATEDVHFNDRVLKVTGSFGVADTGSCVEGNATELLAAADAALFRAKNAGRNCVDPYRGHPLPSATLG